MEELKTAYEHMKDLVKVSVLTLIPLVFVFLIGFIFSDTIVIFLLNFYGVDVNSIVALYPTESLATQFKIAAYLALCFFFPFAIYRAYSFVKPAMPEVAKPLFKKYLPISIFIAFAGITFGTFVFAKFVLYYLQETSMVQIQWSISSVFNFILFSSAVFAVGMQTMVFIPAMNRVGAMPLKLLRNPITRATVAVVLITTASIITPADIVSTIMLATPLYGCYELGLLFSKNNKEVKEWHSDGSK